MKMKVQLQALRNIENRKMFSWLFIMIAIPIVGIALAFSYTEYWKFISCVAAILTGLSWLKYDHARLLIKDVDRLLPYSR